MVVVVVVVVVAVVVVIRGAYHCAARGLHGADGNPRWDVPRQQIL